MDESYTIDFKKVKKNIEIQLKRLDITLKKMQADLGLSVNYLSNAVNQNGMTLTNAYKISKYLGVTIEDLIEKDF